MQRRTLIKTVTTVPLMAETMFGSSTDSDAVQVVCGSEVVWKSIVPTPADIPALAVSSIPALARSSDNVSCSHFGAMNAAGQMAAVERRQQDEFRRKQGRGRRRAQRPHVHERDGQEGGNDLPGSPGHDGRGRDA